MGPPFVVARERITSGQLMIELLGVSYWKDYLGAGERSLVLTRNCALSVADLPAPLSVALILHIKPNIKNISVLNDIVLAL